MRRILSILAVIAILGGLFTLGRFLGGRGGSTPEPAFEQTEQTVPPASTETTEVPSMGQGEGSPWTNTLSEPVKSTDWMGVLTAYLSWHQVNHLAAGRIMAYSGVAFFDAVRTPGTPSLVSDAEGGNSHEVSVSVAARLSAELIGTDSARQEVDEWAEPLSGSALEVYEDVLARAQSDGYDESLNAEIPDFAGPFAWRADPSNDVEPLEPGWGTLTPILLDLDACSIPAADLAAIEAESTIEGIGTSSDSDTAAWAERPEAVGYLASMAYIAHAKYDLTWPPADIVLIENLLLQVAGHDMSIAIWESKWANGIVSPAEYATKADTGSEVFYRTPSYPSLRSAVRQMTVDYLETTRSTTLEWGVGTNTDTYQYFTEVESQMDERIISWGADLDAGARFGACVAEQISALRSQYA